MITNKRYKKLLMLATTGKPATQEFIDGATKTFALWWMSTYETIMKGGN